MAEDCGFEMEARVRSVVRQVLSENVLDDLTTHLVRERVQQRLNAPIAEYKPQISEEINNFLLSVAPLAGPSTERHHRQAISAPSQVVAKLPRSDKSNSGFTGVYYCPASGKFDTYIPSRASMRGKRFFVGSFPTAEEAAIARQQHLQAAVERKQKMQADRKKTQKMQAQKSATKVLQCPSNVGAADCSEPREEGVTLCGQALEGDGGMFGCMLMAFHDGPHQLPRRSRGPAETTETARPCVAVKHKAVAGLPGNCKKLQKPEEAAMVAAKFLTSQGKSPPATDKATAPEPAVDLSHSKSVSEDCLCYQVLEEDGGMFGCTLKAFHQGAHQLPRRSHTPSTQEITQPRKQLRRAESLPNRSSLSNPHPKPRQVKDTSAVQNAQSLPATDKNCSASRRLLVIMAEDSPWATPFCIAKASSMLPLYFSKYKIGANVSCCTISKLF